MSTARSSSSVRPLRFAARKCSSNSCILPSAAIMPRLRMLRSRRDSVSSLQHTPQQYSLTISWKGLLKESAFFVARSTYSSPSTSRRVLRPASSNCLSIPSSVGVGPAGMLCSNRRDGYRSRGGDKHMKRVLGLLLLVCATAALPAQAAESYPSKPVRFIVPFPPGGGTDGLARVLGAKLSETWGQQVIVDNRGGAQGNIGTAVGAKAVADGYTITLGHQGALTINPHLYANPGYDALRDFAPVTKATEMAFILVVHPSLPARSMKELETLAKRNPGKLTFASTSAGPQMAGELFRLTTKTNMLHVPYKGGGPAVIDLLAGHVTIMFSNPTATVPHVQAGKLRALGVMDSKRNPALPNVPTALESGYPD